MIFHRRETMTSINAKPQCLRSQPHDTQMTVSILLLLGPRSAELQAFFRVINIINVPGARHPAGRCLRRRLGHEECMPTFFLLNLSRHLYYWGCGATSKK